MLKSLLGGLLTRRTRFQGAEHAARGLERFAAHDYRAAEREFRAAWTLAPQDPDAQLNLASALCLQGRLAEAAPLARAAFVQDPARTDYRECLKFIALNLGSAQAPQPPGGGADDVMAQIGLGNARRRAGDYDGAEQAYLRALELAPRDPFVAGRLAALRCCQQRYAEAMPYFRVSARAGLQPDGVIDFSAEFLDGLARNGETWRARWQPARLSRAARRHDLAFLLSCDSAYFTRFAFALVHSVQRNAGVDCALHFHVINPDAGVEQAAARIADRFPDVALQISRETRTPDDAYPAKVYYACARFLLVPAALEAYACPVAVLDLDMLVLRSLAPLLERLRGCDLAVPLVAQGRHEPGETLWASFVYFGATPAARRAAAFAGAYVAHFLGRGAYEWFLEQIALLSCRAWARPLDVELELLGEDLIESSDAPGTALEDAFFWTNAHSIAEHAARLGTAQFRRYAADP